jgi:S-adenosylmethionine:tRNA ribosyltransferase-isomerase
VDAFDYTLPDAVVAQRPREPRSAARLAVSLQSGEPVVHATIADLPRFLLPGDVVVVNDTRVIPARLRLAKESGGRVEVLLLEPLTGPLTAAHTGPLAGAGPAAEWEALVRPGRRVPAGTTLVDEIGPAVVVGDRLPGDDGRRRVRLVDPAVIDRAGVVPLPPYIHEPLDDPERYQTVYATTPGSVAAPTAGLHFTDDVLAACRRVGATLARVDLVVGMDTFRPVTAQDPADHVMHSERYTVPDATRRACDEATRVVAVGTTTLRALEAAAATGVASGRTDLFVRGDFPFRVVDVLVTNFHLPRSTLLLLVDAFYGPRWRALYAEAMAAGYRFLSFGDAMLLARGAGRDDDGDRGGGGGQDPGAGGNAGAGGGGGGR